MGGDCKRSLSPNPRPWASDPGAGPQTLAAVVGAHRPGAWPWGAVPRGGSERTEQGGPQPPGRLLSPSLPWGWHPRPCLRGVAAAVVDSRGPAVEEVGAAARDETVRSPADGPGSSSSSPGQLDWLLAWDRPRHPLTQYEVPASRPFCRPFRFSVVSFSSSVLSNGFTTRIVTEIVG